jgi:cytochrome P450
MSEETVRTEGAAPPGCPHFDFDPLDPAHGRDPWQRLAQARDEQPVFYMASLDMWCVTRYDDVRAALHDPGTFSNSSAIELANPVPDEVTVPPGCVFPDLRSIGNIDPPDHTRQRKLIQPAFTPKRVNRWADEIRAIADGLIDEFIAEGQVDLVTAYSNPIPIRAIATILGFPPDAAAKFRHWTDSFFDLLGVPGLPHDRAVELWTGLVESDEYVRSLIEERRRQPADDLVSNLVTSVADDGAPALTDDEITANVHAFVVAGTDTTAILISNAVHLLLAERSRWQEVVDDPGLIDNAIEETLRFRGPLRGNMRVATRECELGGVRLPKGAKLYWMPSSANLDAAHYEDPDRFDLHRRAASDHMAFGLGTHFCIGAPLARLEGRIALERLIARLPSLRLLDQTLEYTPNIITPAPSRLRVEWDPTGS